MSQPLKFKGTALFNGRQLLDGSMVLVMGTDGTVQDIVPEAQAGPDVQLLDGILCPGFVNSHCHLELSHMKGVIPENTGLPAFLTAVMERRGSMDEALQQRAMEQAAAGMWEEGISAVGDICNGTATLPYKQQGRLYYHTFVECMGVAPAFATQRLAYSMEVYRQFRAINGRLHSCSVVPHAPYSLSRELFALLAALPDNSPLSIHNQESEAENALYRDKTGPFLEFYRHFGMDASGFTPTGTNSLPGYLPWLGRHPLLLVHNTYTTEQDIRFAQEHAPRAYWCLCPRANLYIEQRLPDVELLMRQGCTLVVGTDSLASNHGLSVWEEVQTLRRHFPAIPLATMLQWATLNGAEALGIAHTYGSFEKGKRPGLVLLAEGSKRVL